MHTSTLYTHLMLNKIFKLNSFYKWKYRKKSYLFKTEIKYQNLKILKLIMIT